MLASASASWRSDRLDSTCLDEPIFVKPGRPRNANSYVLRPIVFLWCKKEWCSQGGLDPIKTLDKNQGANQSHSTLLTLIFKSPTLKFYHKMGFWWIFILNLKLDYVSQPCSKIILLLLRKAPRTCHTTTPPPWILCDSLAALFLLKSSKLSLAAIVWTARSCSDRWSAHLRWRSAEVQNEFTDLGMLLREARGDKHGPWYRSSLHVFQTCPSFTICIKALEEIDRGLWQLSSKIIVFFSVQKRICIKALSTTGLKSPLSNVLLLWLGLGWMPGKLSLLFRSHNREERLEQKTWDHECLRGNIGDPWC